MASSEHESRAASSMTACRYVTRRDLHATVALLPLALPIERNHEQDETSQDGTPAEETRDPLGIRDGGGIPRDPEGEMRELDQESRVASIAGQKLNVARFELLRLKM